MCTFTVAIVGRKSGQLAMDTVHSAHKHQVTFTVSSCCKRKLLIFSCLLENNRILYITILNHYINKYQPESSL